MGIRRGTLEVVSITGGEVRTKQFPQDVRKTLEKFEVIRTGPHLWNSPLQVGNLMAAVAMNIPPVVSPSSKKKDSFNNQYLKEYQFGKIFGFFTLLAIFITSIGLYGLTAYATLKRRKEIGLRKVNGATSLSILFLLLKDYALLVIIAFVFACPASYILIQNWLQNYAYKTEVSWWIIAIAGLLSMLIALVTITTHAWKVSASNPVLALKHE
jgi:ABC-type antimicrobial peptide transport system permease subunit